MKREIEVEFSEIIGKKVIDISNVPDSMITLSLDNNGMIETYHMYHDQDCCEHVYLDEIVGANLNDLVDEEILDAYVSTSSDIDTSMYDLAMWTFYTIRTMNNTLTLRWLGSSNGYYSVGVSTYKVVNNI